MIRTVTQTYVVCPSCNSNINTIDHLLTSTISWGPWYCACGQGVFGTVKDGKVEVSPDLSKRHDKSITLLYRDDLVFFVKSPCFSDWDAEQKKDLQYLYEEHLCPINWLGDIFEVYDCVHQEKDPHGIFEYVYTSVPVPVEDWDRLDGMTAQQLGEYIGIDLTKIKDVVAMPLNVSGIDGLYYRNEKALEKLKVQPDV